MPEEVKFPGDHRYEFPPLAERNTELHAEEGPEMLTVGVFINETQETAFTAHPELVSPVTL